MFVSRVSFAPQRPTGVAVVAALEVIIGIFSLIEGPYLIIGPKVAGIASNPKFGADVGAFGVIISVLGLFALTVSYGIWTRKRWAWTYAFMISGLGILTNITTFFFGVSFSVLGAGLQLLVIYYLTRPNVKSFFPKLYPATTPKK
jgi:hypothetical protein